MTKETEETSSDNRTKIVVVLALLVAVIVGVIAGVTQDGDDAAVAPPTLPPTPGIPTDLTILHMNDHHSHLEEDDFDIEVAELPEDFPVLEGEPEEIEVLFGGFPRLVSLVKQLTDEALDEGKEVLKLHAGDALVGTIFYSLFEAEADAAMMNQICFDAFALGNHEFDDGDSNLAEFIQKLQEPSGCPLATPVLAANLVPSSASPLVQLTEDGALVSHVIKTLGNGEQVGIIGIDIANKTMFSSQPDEGTILLDERETAEAQVALLTAQGIDKIVILSHIGYENDISWMAEIDGVDVVVGGDSHTLLGEVGSTAKGFPGGAYPTLKASPSGGTVCVVQAWEYAHGVGKLDVSFDEFGHVVSCMGETLLPFDSVQFDPALDDETAGLLTSYIEATYPSMVAIGEGDAETISILQGFKEQTDELKTTVIASVPEDICFERIPGQGRSKICPVEASSTQGGGVCNLVAKAFLEQTFEADIAIQNGGGCRTDITSGDFTYGSAYELLPFANTLVTLDLTGAEIIQVLGEAMSFAFGPDSTADGYPYTGSTGAYPYASGLRFTVDLSVPGFVTGVEVNSRVEGSWEAIDLEETYSVVTNSYIAGGRDGYLTFGNTADELITDTYQEYAQSFIDYAKVEGELINLPLEEYATQAFLM